MTKKNGIYKKCIMCGSSFYCYNYLKDIKDTCSKKCFNKKRKGIPTWNKGIPMSEEAKRKLSEKNKGVIRKNRIFNKCLFCNKEFTDLPYLMKTKKYCSKGCVSKSKIGRVLTKHTRDKISIKAKGRKLSELIKSNMSIASKKRWQDKDYRKNKLEQLNKNWEKIRGKTSHMKGKHHSQETKELISRKLKGKLQGENHPNWLGGKSFEPYDKKWTEEFKRGIRNRDNNICMKCGVHQEKEIRKLNVHHIDYIKINSTESNCITLCHKCNIEVNANRKYWIKFFQSIMVDRYGYNYPPENQREVF